MSSDHSLPPLNNFSVAGWSLSFLGQLLEPGGTWKSCLVVFTQIGSQSFFYFVDY